jgi:carbamoyl-phosphate synthase large subunit
MVQRLMGGPEFSIDILCDLDGRCLNAIPRTMLESRGGESIKGAAIADAELIVRMALGETIEPHVGEFRAGRTFTRFFWHLELDEQLRPTGRDIVADGRPRAPR